MKELSAFLGHLLNFAEKFTEASEQFLWFFFFFFNVSVFYYLNDLPNLARLTKFLTATNSMQKQNTWFHNQRKTLQKRSVSLNLKLLLCNDIHLNIKICTFDKLTVNE